MTIWNWKTISCRSVVLTALMLGAGLFHPTFAQDEDSKIGQTPYFCQLDPKANFPNQGSNYCAPASITDGLVYLATARGMDDLVDATDHDGQIALVKELGEAMGTDPAAGTGPDQILSGLRTYVEGRGYSFERLEIASWRSVTGDNKKCFIGAKPDLEWLTRAVADPDTIVLGNFGWYKQGANGIYARNSGHWVNIADTGEEGCFEIRNPALKPDVQQKNTSIELTPVEDDFVYKWPGGKGMNMAGYFQAEGVGLPFGKQYVTAAVLDAVIVFKLKKD